MARDILYLKDKNESEKAELAKLDSKLDMVMHVLSDISTIKEHIALSTTKVEGRLSLLESMLQTVNAQQKKQKPRVISSSAMKSVLQGPSEDIRRKHRKNHSIGLLSTPMEEDDRPEFDFGHDEEEREEVASLLKEVHSMPPVFPLNFKEKIFGAFNKSEHNISYDTAMEDTGSTSHIPALGINGTNKLISQLPEQPVLNIQCQSRAEIKDALQILTNWVTYKKTQDASYTPQYLALQLVAGFSGLAFEWWRWLLTETKQDILRAEDAEMFSY